MKSKTWIMLLSVLLVACVALSLVVFLPGESAAVVQVISEGQVLYVLPLSIEQSVTVQTEKGINVVTVRGGKVAVTHADCPDGYCMDRGFCSGGAPIVCLPNRLVLRFTGRQALDTVVG